MEHTDVYRVVDFEKSFYIEEIQFDKDKEILGALNQNFTEESIRNQEKKLFQLSEDRKAILYYRTKQHDFEAFEKYYDAEDETWFDNWVEKNGGEILNLNAEYKKQFDEAITDVTRSFGSFNFTFGLQASSQVFKIVPFARSFYVAEVEFDVEDNNRIF
ncbi:unnamed protein product [Caenorhabditis angaria]|uniref:Uncharacterized protein n=1 Tax=Caenorhabditis angaria TaxID=860376 RepID=A0A9P1IGT7_9PELO|nr:unnamed protein product [Caenorhabditis angaria]